MVVLLSTVYTRANSDGNEIEQREIGEKLTGMIIRNSQHQYWGLCSQFKLLLTENRLKKKIARAKSKPSKPAGSKSKIKIGILQ